MSHGGLGLLALTMASVGLPTGSASGAPVPVAVKEPPVLRILWDRVLPAPAERAVDIRWASDASVVLALATRGLVELPVDLEGAAREWVPAQGRPGSVMGCSRIGLSNSFLSVSPPFHVLGWRPRDGLGLQQLAGFDHIADLDVFEDRLLILAVRRTERGEYAPEGAIAWLGSLRQGLTDLRPVLYDRSGAGARNFDACGPFEMGAVRFLTDGSFLVLPGVQPGLHHYDADGRLRHTWDTGSIGLDSDCASLTEDEVTLLAGNLGARFGWLNQRQTVDEILVLPNGPALVVRSVDGGRTHWRLVQLSRGGGALTFRLPVASAGPFEHLRGDFRNGRIVFVFFGAHVDAQLGRTVFAPSRLLELASP